MYLLLTAKPKWIKNLNPKVKVKVSKSRFSKMKKNRDLFSLFESILVRIVEGDTES